jgi:hypothetical protein
MRSYLLDEIAPNDMKKINEFLEKNAIQSSLDKIFWIQIPEELLTQVQLQHKGCGPYICALELGKDWIKLEFYVRSSKNMRCICSGYCTAEQRDFVIGYVNRMIDDLGVRT